MKVLLVEPTVGSLQALRHTLRGAGIRDISTVEGVVPDPTKVPLATFDLILLDADDHDAAALGFVQDVRTREVKAANPFVPMIVTTFKPTRRIVRNSTSTGVDQLLTKPTSVKVVMRRIHRLARGSRPWLVTPSYLGPDRRSVQRRSVLPGTQIEVPNPIFTKISGAPIRNTVHEMEQAWMAVHRAHLGQIAARFVYLIRQALLDKQYGLPESAAQRVKTAAPFVASIARKAAGLDSPERVIALCQQLTPMIPMGARGNVPAIYEMLNIGMRLLQYVATAEDASVLIQAIDRLAPVPQANSYIDAY